MSDKSEEIKEEIKSVDPEMATHLVRAFEIWEQLREYKAKESKRVNEKVSARQAQFAEAMHVGHASANDQILKLTVVEQRWQELDDARTERKEVMSALKDQIKSAEQRIRDGIAEARSGQGTFDFSSEEEPSSDDGDDDADDTQG